MINGIKTYVATPKVDYPRDKAIIYLPDVFGLELPNSRVRCPPSSQPNLLLLFLLTNPIHWQLLVDDFARNGFKVYAPDLYEGEPVPPDALTTVCRPLSPHCPSLALTMTHIQGNFDFPAWLGKHGPKHTGERARKVIEGLKGQGITVYGGTGYCYGGTIQTSIWGCAAMLNPSLFQLARLVFDLAFDNVIQVAVVAHPSLLKPEDLDVRYSSVDILTSPLSVIPLQTYITKSTAPLLINSCELDEAFPKSFAETADQRFAYFAPGYRRTHYEGASHGFAVRGDIVREYVSSLHCPEAHSASLVQSKPAVKTAKEGAFKGSVEWLIKYLQ